VLYTVVRVAHRDGLDPGERAGRFLLCALESLQARVDAPPARAHEIDEERQIVHASVPLGEQLALEALKPANRLIEESPDFGNVSRDGQDFCAEAVPNGAPDLNRDRRFELGRRNGKRLDLTA